MSVRPAAFAALVVALVAASPARADDRLTLDDAFARVASAHPDLRLTLPRAQALQAERDEAAQRPAFTAGATLENAFGTGDYAALDSAEATLTLASVLERGGKRDARLALAQGRIDSLAVQREATRLDLLAETARRHLAVVAAQRNADIANADIEQRRRAVSAARERMNAGGAPESVMLTAQAALAKSELDLRRAQQAGVAAKQHLAALWGEREPRFDLVAGDPLALPAIADFDVLARDLQGTPELRAFADRQRIAEARVRLAETQRSADIEWQVGARWLNASEDMALIASASIPLGAARRAEPGIRAAQSELAALEIERESQDLSLYSTLVEAHGRYRVAQLEVLRLGEDVLPRLQRAETAAERAWRAGATTYLEWSQLQSERTAMRRQQLDAALDAQRALIEIQRLTGQPLVQPSRSRETGVSP